MLRTYCLVLALLICGPLMLGRQCQALDGTQSSRPAPPDPSRFVPNYCAVLGGSPTWSTFPVRVYFERDSNYTADREKNARLGMDLWTTATHGLLRYTVVTDRTKAQVFIVFDPSTNAGNTTMRSKGGHTFDSHITLGVHGDVDVDSQAIAGHEFGHALGINGHSDDEHDIMFRIHLTGTRERITERDLNTMKSLYPSLFPAPPVPAAK